MTRTAHALFHGIGTPLRPLDPGEEDYWVVDTSRFADILDAVADDPTRTISFDDGNTSDVEIALPALLERGLTATFFVLSGRLGAPGSLTRGDVEALLAAGMRVGTHGMHHVPWRRLDDRSATDELVTARRELEQLVGAPIDSAALPFGRYDRATLARLRQLGYHTICTSDRRLATPGSFLQHRFSVLRDDTPQSVVEAFSRSAGVPHRMRKGAIGLVKRWVA